MKLPKLTKEETAEGLSPELLMQFNEHRSYSPVQLLPGDEPAHLLKCSTGYWMRDADNGGYLRDAKGRLVMVSDRECRIGRARYLLNFGLSEKAEKVVTLVESWKTEVRRKIDDVKANLDMLEDSFSDNPKSLNGILIKASESDFTPSKNPKWRQEQLEATRLWYPRLEDAYLKGEFVELMSALDIRTFDNPMLTVSLDNDAQMQILKNTFGRQALENWDGDMLTLYASIEIEKQYAGL